MRQARRPVIGGHSSREWTEPLVTSGGPGLPPRALEKVALRKSSDSGSLTSDSRTSGQDQEEALGCWAESKSVSKTRSQDGPKAEVVATGLEVGPGASGCKGEGSWASGKGLQILSLESGTR